MATKIVVTCVICGIKYNPISPSSDNDFFKLCPFHNYLQGNMFRLFVKQCPEYTKWQESGYVPALEKLYEIFRRGLVNELLK